MCGEAVWFVGEDAAVCEAVHRFSLVSPVSSFLFYFSLHVLAQGCALLTFKRKKNKAMQKSNLT